MPTPAWDLASKASRFGSPSAGDTVSGALDLLTAGKIVAVAGVGQVREAAAAEIMSAAVRGTANTWTALQTFSAGLAGTTLALSGGVTCAGTLVVASGGGNVNDGISLSGRAGGASSFRVNFIPDALSASYTVTVPAVTGRMVVSVAGAASFQLSPLADTLIISGRGGGSGSFSTTRIPTALSSSTIITVPNLTGTMAVTGASQDVSFGGITIASANYIYLRGNASTDGSVRMSSQASGTCRIERRTSGSWVIMGSFA